MPTLTKIVDPRARPAAVLLKRAGHLALTSAGRAALPAQLDADGQHLHHTLAGHAPLEVGDVLLDERGSLWLVEPAAEAVWHVGGPMDALHPALYWLGTLKVRVALHGDSFHVLPNAVPRAMLESRGLTILDEIAPFAPLAIVTAADDSPGHVHGPDCGHDHGHGHEHRH